MVASLAEVWRRRHFGRGCVLDTDTLAALARRMNLGADRLDPDR